MKALNLESPIDSINSLKQSQITKRRTSIICEQYIQPLKSDRNKRTSYRAIATDNTDPESNEARYSWGSLHPFGERPKNGSFLDLLRMNLGATPSNDSARTNTDEERKHRLSSGS